METQAYAERGYLLEDFRLFHLRGAMEEQLDWHYHTFHKLVFFLGGSAGYGVEGRSFRLERGDAVLVPQGCIHRPEAAPGAPYERVILYLSPEFLSRMSGPDCPLDACFARSSAQFRFVLRPGPARRELLRNLSALEEAVTQPGFGAQLLAQALLVQLLISLRRLFDADGTLPGESIAADEKVAAILQYLSQHLTERVSIDDLAARFYISKYHMMRRFRAETGCTIHAYLAGKRLALAREQIAAGVPAGQAAAACGFGDYSAFCRAYRRRFGLPPSSARGA